MLICLPEYYFGKYLFSLNQQLLFFYFLKYHFSIFFVHLQSKTERGYLYIMIIINVKDGESLDKALKRFKKKFEKTGVLRELRSRQAYEKKSITRRTQVKKAIYKQGLNIESV